MANIALNIAIFLPAVAAIVIWNLPERRADLAKVLSLVTGTLIFMLGFGLWLALPATGLLAETHVPWIKLSEGGLTLLDISYHVGLDAISGSLVALTGLLVPLSVWCSFSSIRKREREYYAWMMGLTAAMVGVFAARDLLLFYIFFEFTLVPLYFLIGIWGGSERRYAANKFFLYTFVGSVITFAGILYLVIRTAGGGTVTFDIATIVANVDVLTSGEQSLLFLALFCGFAIKVPFFPLHTWLPLAHTEAPTAGSVLLAGVLLKLGTYGFLRFALPMAPEGAVAWAQVMGWLAIVGIIYGALCSWVQTDVKKLVAYSSVSHLGFCMLGMFSLLPMGLSGSVLYMINHGLSTGALFLVVGMIYERYHTRDMNKLGGLATQMPVMAFFLVLFTLSSVGLPGLNGFISEFTVLFAAYNSPLLGPLYGTLGATGILLGAIYMLYMAGRVLFGPVNEPEDTPDLVAVKTQDLNGREIAILTPIAVLCIVLGIAPRLLTDKLDPVLRTDILDQVQPAVTAYLGNCSSNKLALADTLFNGTVSPDPTVSSTPNAMRED
jgi:NADH-quinone oxidoreductase subunit M